MPKKISLEETRKKKQYIYDEYFLNKKTMKEIANAINAHEEHIRRIFKENGWKALRGKTGYRENPDIIIKMYKNGISSNKIAEELKIGPTTVLRVLKENNVQIRTLHEAKSTYYVNEHYFDEIDTPNKAYVLGMLYADGCNHAKRNMIKLALQEDDIDILEKIKKELEYTGPIAIRKTNKSNKNTAVIAIYSKIMSNALTKWGCTERKSLTLTFPDFLSPKLMSHFLRGYFDGDGGIRKKGRGCTITLTSSCYFIEGLEKYIKRHLKKKYNYIIYTSKNGITQTFTISQKQHCHAFLRYLYRDAEIFLNRKYDIYFDKFLKGKRGIKKLKEDTVN